MEHDRARITVREALELPEMRAGLPELVAGEAGLERAARWAHVVAGTAAAQLLDGGELVLTTGAAWPRDAEGLETLAARLLDAEPAAVVLELGHSFDAAPAPLAAACEARGVPLVVLRREVRFVQITQRIHQRVLADQHEALAARAEVHAMLTELGLNRSPVDYVIERLAGALDAPVVLEDSARRVVAWSGSASAEHVLAAWSDARALSLPDGRDRVPVEAQGRRWGHLTALQGPPHPAGRRTVLELGAFALALGRLADPEGEQWLQLGSKRMFEVLLEGRYRSADELAAQLAASGLPVEGRVLLGATLCSTGGSAPADFGHDGPPERTMLETALRRAVSPDGRVLIAPDTDAGAAGSAGAEHGRPILLALLSFPPGDRRTASAGSAAPPFAVRLAQELDALLPETAPASWGAHLGLGPSGTRIRALITSLEQVRAAGMLDPSASVGRVTVQQAERQPLAYLVRGLAATPEVQEFAAEALGPLLEHDGTTGPGHSGDLLRVLQAYLEQPANRSLAARRARLSRSVFYQRLALIEELLDVDLADGAVIATLTVALLARR
ncbi:PucR family transcriptional regulator [Leucobacter sp. wl10]|uniref:PucR family transcriptional regulator n=1 Tax=Leucobacter sp. wl10 TaxID=2304677 RepID=UPI000E5B6DA6|nr:PucR family transcriptional regulator [Leucobacter sp. wl10]RGE23251.1 PucR family transcriptional regulator [Leucobacter sp. wl10]